MPPNFPTDEHHANYGFVYRSIDSCETEFQFLCCEKMIDLFGIKFPEQVQLKILLIDLYNDLYQQVIKGEYKSKTA